MSPYQIFETDQFRKELSGVGTPQDQHRVGKKLVRQVYPRLREQPHFGNQIKKLRDYEPESWRYRIGPLRLFYSIDETKRVVLMTAVRFRKEAYR